MYNHQKIKARLSEESYQLILGRIEDPVAVCDNSGTLIFFNEPYRKVFIENTTPAAIPGFFDTTEKKCPFCRIAELNGSFEHDNLGEFEHKGKLYDHKTSTLPSTNGVVFCLHLLKDITKSIKAEKNLARAVEKAEKSERLKNSFLANISHEVRTPMNAIMGFSDLLDVDGVTLEEKLKYISIIKSSSVSLLKVVDNIILYSRIQSGDISFNLTGINIPDLINEVCSEFMDKVADNPKNISISIDIPVNACSLNIYSDRPSVKRIMANLLDNAWKFTDSGRIDVGCRVIEGGTDRVRLFVRDTGIGISNDHKSLIFEPFRQLEDTVTKRYGGTGLGLTIVRELLSKLGSDISFISEKNSGSDFRFELATTVR